MKFYKVSLHTHEYGHDGYVYCTSKAEAEKAVRQFNRDLEGYGCNCEITMHTIKNPLTLSTLINLLNRHGGHSDNG